MIRSRMIKTLVALIAAMTVGTLALVLMETAPVHPTVIHLSAVVSPADDSSDVISHTDAAIRPGRWRSIVVHTAAEGLDADGECHFIVERQPAEDGRFVRATGLWNRQGEGNHVFAAGYNWNADSIGIYLADDFNQAGPSARQFKAIMSLVRSLQQTCGITADRVYLNRDIDPRSLSPGAAFPAETFNANLLKPSGR